MSRTSNAQTVDEYLEELPDPICQLLQNIRAVILDTAPDAQEVISYRMPAYKFHGMLIGFAAFANHCSLFLWKKDSLHQFAQDLKEFSLSEGTIRFTLEHPVPLDLVRKIVAARMNENIEKGKSKSKTR